MLGLKAQLNEGRDCSIKEDKRHDVEWLETCLDTKMSNMEQWSTHLQLRTRLAGDVIQAVGLKLQQWALC